MLLLIINFLQIIFQQIKYDHALAKYHIDWIVICMCAHQVIEQF